MTSEKENLMDCSQFEERLTDYLEKTLDGATHKSAAAHVLSCPLCHSLLNEVKSSLEVCHLIVEPPSRVTRLEARILSATVPQMSMECDDFESHLTDYLDGFLPAQLFHRWERHAVLCDNCSDLPGAVVRSLAACVSYKMEELPLPAGLHKKIMQETIGTDLAKTVKASASARFGEWMRKFSFPISVPQFAPVAIMLFFAFMVVSQTVSADGSLTDIYKKSVAMAEQTYKQGADAWNGNAGDGQTDGTTEVDSEGGN